MDFDKFINRAAQSEGGEADIAELTAHRTEFETLKKTLEDTTVELQRVEKERMREQIALEELRRMNGELLANITVKEKQNVDPEVIDNILKYRG